MNILDEQNEWAPKEVTLDYQVYKGLLDKITSYPDVIKTLTEDGTHVLIKQVSPNGTITYALVTKEKFQQVQHQFK